MSELRWNPILREWVITATHRQERPQMPKGWCPFCPGSGKVPDDYDVYIYPNDFPSLSIPPPEPAVSSTRLYPVEESRGVCDVVLYHPDHHLSLSDLDIDHIVKLVNLWRARFNELAEMNDIKYVFIFENRGDVIGVTIPHPHCQIYAFPFIPPKVEVELNSSLEYFNVYGRCLFCDIMGEEMDDGRRVIFENRSFFAFVPFFARWPYEVHIYSERHIKSIADFTDDEINDFAEMLKIITQKYDNLFGFPFPYMMIFHQAPTDGGKYPFYHFHIEFYPPYRSRTKLKYLAGCESGAGTFINDTLPEEKAKELRDSPAYR
jgi:UDPglucose--hexose-1-phosphate uridylyltransferase